MTQPSEGLVTERKVVARLGGIVARLRSMVQRRPLLEGLVSKVNAQSDLFCEQYDIAAPIRVASINRFQTLRAFYAPDATAYSECGDRQRTRRASQ